MSSSTGVEQREKEEKALRSFLAFSLIGSIALHIVVLTLSSFWIRKPELVEKPIEFIVVDAPSLQAAKPKQKTPSKIASIVKASSRRKLGTQSIKTIAASRSNGSQAGGTPSTSSAPSSQSTASKPSVALPPPTVISKKPSTPDAIAQKPVAQTPPKLLETPKLAQTPPPFSTKPPLPTPEPVETPTPTPVATKPPKPAQPRNSERIDTKPALVRSQPPTATPKPTSTFQPPQPVAPSPPQVIARNSARQSDNTRGVTDAYGGLPQRPDTAAGSGNRDSSSTRSSGDRSSGHTGSNGLGNGSGKGSGNGSGNGRAVATGSRSGSTTGSGSGGVVCRRCPLPDYPPGTDNLEARTVVLIDIDRNGNVSDVQTVGTSGNDILDQTALETVKKKWKFIPSGNEQRTRVVVYFGNRGSNFYRQARERVRQARKRAQQRERERQAREQQQP